MFYKNKNKNDPRMAPPPHGPISCLLLPTSRKQMVPPYAMVPFLYLLLPFYAQALGLHRPTIFLLFPTLY